MFVFIQVSNKLPHQNFGTSDFHTHVALAIFTQCLRLADLLRAHLRWLDSYSRFARDRLDYGLVKDDSAESKQ
jgi:hypothetical protein